MIAAVRRRLVIQFPSEVSLQRGDGMELDHAEPAIRAHIFATLRRTLSARHLTYADLGRRTGLSEQTVKRLFRDRDCKLSRLVAICRALDLSLDEVLEAGHRPPDAGTQLPLATEQELAANPPIFHVFLLILDGFTPTQIAHEHTLSDASMTLHLADIERLGLIERTPGGQARLTVQQPLLWRWDGPLRQRLVDMNRDFVSWSIRNKARPDVDFRGVTRRMRPQTASMLQDDLQAVEDRYKRLAQIDQMTTADDALVGVKWTSAMAPLPYRDLQHIPVHRRDPEGRRPHAASTKSGRGVS